MGINHHPGSKKEWKYEGVHGLYKPKQGLPNTPLFYTSYLQPSGFRHEYMSFLDDFSDYNQIPLH